MNWQEANATAMLRAPQAHRDLGVDREGYVDVFTALDRAGVHCIGRHMPRLFGWYCSADDDGPAVLLNAALDEIQLRHTAAHELGHHVFNHGSQFDTDLDIAGTPGRGWTREEMQAESFAAWFLMPLPAVELALRRIGSTTVTSPREAYELARWLGTSYAGTVRHLHRLKKISKQTAEKWAAMPLSRIRSQLYRGPLPRSSSGVFPLRRQGHEGVLRVSAGDVLVPQFSGAVERLPTGLQLWQPSPATADGDQSSAEELFAASELYPLAVQVTETFTSTGIIAMQVPGHDDAFAVTVVPVPRRYGVAAVWTTSPDLDRSDEVSTTD